MPTLTIDPVTRIEGHSKITIQLNEGGEVQDAHFHVTVNSSLRADNSDSISGMMP